MTCTCAGPWRGWPWHEHACGKDEAELVALEARDALVDRLLRAFGVDPERVTN